MTGALRFCAEESVEKTIEKMARAATKKPNRIDLSFIERDLSFSPDQPFFPAT